MRQRRRTRLRRVVWTAVGLAALLVAAYGYLTNPTRLRAQALAALRCLPMDGVDVAHVTFSPWSGLELIDLVVIPAGSSTPLHRDPSLPSPLLHVARARVDCDLLALLLGRLRPTEIDVSRAAVTIICQPADARGASQSQTFDDAARGVWGLLTATEDRLPPVTIEQADLQLMVTEHGRQRLLERWLLRVTGRPAASGYRVRVERLPSRDQPLAELRWAEATGELEVMLDWVDLSVVRPLLPRRPAETLALLNLRGRARIERLLIRTEREGAGVDPGVRHAAAEVHLADLQGVIPLEEPGAQESAAARRERLASAFLQVGQGGATVTYRGGGPDVPGQLGLRANGRLNGAPMSFTLDAAGDLLARLWARPENAPAGSPPDPALDLDDVLQAELYVAGLELPTAQSHPAFVRSSRLPRALTNAFKDYQARGKANLWIGVLPRATPASDAPRSNAVARIEGELEPLGASCRYSRFPYDFHDARGRLRFTGGRILLEGLCGRHGSSRICAEGTVNNSRSWTGFELTFRGESIALDDDLCAALPDEYRQLWQSAAPLGLCDVVTTVRRDEGSEQTGAAPSEVHVDAHLLGGSLALGDARRLHHADGRLSIHGGQVQVHDLHGYNGDATVRLSGSVWMADGVPQTDLRVAVVDLPLDESATLAAGSEGPAPRVRFVGRADVWGHVYGSGEGGGRRHDLAVRIKDGELHAFDPARTWTECRGWVTVRDERRRLESFTCRQGKAWFDAAGTLPTAAEPRGALSLNLRAGTAAVEELLSQFVPAEWTEFADALGLAGPGEVSVRLRPSGDEGPAAGQAADIELRADQMRARPMPLGLRDVAAHLTVAPGRFELRRADARWGEAGAIQAHGQGNWRPGDVQVEFGLAARGLTFCPELIEALPGPVARLLKRLSPQGQFDALLPRVHLSGGRQRTWRLEGRLPLRQTALRLGLELSGLKGELSGVCTIDPEGEVELDAKLAIERAELAGRPIERWEGRLLRGRGERWVRLDDLRGRLCDGEALGFVRIDPQTSEYELSLTLQDVRASQLLPPSKEHPQRERPGRIDANVYLRGRAGKSSSRRGGGELRLRGASFLQTPVLASVSTAGREDQRAISDKLDQAEVRFLWEGSQLRLLRVEIQSRDLRLIGEGTWNMHDDTIRMTLVGAHPRHWPRLLMLSDLIELAGQELVQYRVEGTLASPTVITEPLYKLNETLRALLKSGEDSGEVRR